MVPIEFSKKLNINIKDINKFYKKLYFVRENKNFS